MQKALNAVLVMIVLGLVGFVARATWAEIERPATEARALAVRANARIDAHESEHEEQLKVQTEMRDILMQQKGILQSLLNAQRED